MRGVRIHIVLALAALALALSSAAALAKPHTKEVGRYDVTVSGHYSGSGMALVTTGGVTIRADLADEDGNVYKLQTPRLSRDPDRHYLFRGEGTLGNMRVTIDGRVDAADDRKAEVLQAGRIVFTFKVQPNGHHGRGAGEKKSNGANNPSGGSDGGGGGGNGGSGGGSSGGGEGGSGKPGDNENKK